MEVEIFITPDNFLWTNTPTSMAFYKIDNRFYWSRNKELTPRAGLSDLDNEDITLVLIYEE